MNQAEQKYGEAEAGRSADERQEQALPAMEREAKRLQQQRAHGGGHRHGKGRTEEDGEYGVQHENASIAENQGPGAGIQGSGLRLGGE